MLIYLASPYTSPTEEQRFSNAMVQVDTAVKLMVLGHKPFAPLLSHWIDKRAMEQSIDIPYDTWMDYCLTWLSKCDALLYLGKSKGSDIELQFAKDNHMKIYYTLEEVTNEI